MTELGGSLLYRDLFIGDLCDTVFQRLHHANKSTLIEFVCERG